MIIRDYLICLLQMYLLEDLEKNILPYRRERFWEKFLVYCIAALAMFGTNRLESSILNMVMIPVIYMIASMVVFRGNIWKKLVTVCCYYVLAIIPEFLFAGYERVEFEMLNLEESMDKQQMALHSYDVVISVNALHRNIDAVDAVKKVAELLKPNGILLMTDLVVRTYLQELTATFLENGFADIRDKRKEAGMVTPDCLLWRECLSEAGLGQDIVVTEEYGRCICCSRQQASVLSYYDGALREYLSEKLPEYMVPQNYHFMAQLPTLSNGKINRKKLREDFKEETSVIRFSKAVTETEEKLLDIWKRMFGYENLGTEDNYFVLGGDSLIATKLISDIQKEFGCKIMISDIFENVTIKLLAQKIDLVRQNVIMEDIEMECGEI